jgi:hypothetical protein
LSADAHVLTPRQARQIQEVRVLECVGAAAFDQIEGAFQHVQHDAVRGLKERARGGIAVEVPYCSAQLRAWTRVRGA